MLHIYSSFNQFLTKCTKFFFLIPKIPVSLLSDRAKMKSIQVVCMSHCCLKEFIMDYCSIRMIETYLDQLNFILSYFQLFLNHFHSLNLNFIMRFFFRPRFCFNCYLRDLMVLQLFRRVGLCLFLHFSILFMNFLKQ